MASEDKKEEESGSSDFDWITVLLALLMMVCALASAWYAKKWYECKKLK